MAVKLMYINNVDTHNYPFCRLQLVVKTCEQYKLNEDPKVVPLLKNFGD